VARQEICYNLLTPLPMMEKEENRSSDMIWNMYRIGLGKNRGKSRKVWAGYYYAII